MFHESVPLIVGFIILLSSLISLRIGISVAIVEIVLGAIAGNMGMEPEAWMTYIAGLGGIVLTFLAGAEIDLKMMHDNFKGSFLIGFFSFLSPFIIVFLYTYFAAQWSYEAALIAGIALSTTSLAVVYSVLVESGLSSTYIGKMLMAATFITDMGTALALSVLFVKFSMYTALFIAVSIAVIIIGVRFTGRFFDHPRISGKVIEPEIKFILLLLLILIFFAKLGEGQAVLPAFVMGMLMSKLLAEHKAAALVKKRIRTVAYAFITPIFFIAGGLRISFTMIYSAFALFAILFLLKIISKFAGVYIFANRFTPGSGMYTTLLMSTGLTFGTISSVYGLNAGIINQTQYSILIGAVVASAVIPTFIAQKWFQPKHNEERMEQ